MEPAVIQEGTEGIGTQRLLREFTANYTPADVSSQLQAAIDQASRDLEAEEENNVMLFGDHGGQHQVEARWRAVNILDNSSTPPSPTTLYKAEVAYAEAIKSRSGLGEGLSWWNTRLNKVLVELYNKDLIDLPPESVVFDDENPGLTDASVISEQAFLGINYADIASRRKISDTTARIFSNLALYKIEWVGDYQQSNNPPYGFYSELLDIPQNIKTIEEIEGMADGNGRAANDIHRGVVIAYDNGYGQSININNVNAIVDIGLNEDFMRSGIWPVDRIALQYVFLNYSSEWNTYIDGLKYIEDYPYPLSNLATGLKDYITQSRNSIRRYLTNINDLEKIISELSVRHNNLINIRDDAIRIKESNAKSAQVLADNAANEISPFVGSLPGDENFTIHKGGGRKVEVDSLVALQWEQRFRRWECRGVPDIMNYGPKEGGVAYQDKKERYWGWHTNRSKNVDEELIKWTNYGGKANLGDWDYPKSILDMNALRYPETYEWWAPWTARPGEFNIAGNAMAPKEDWWKGSQPPFQHYADEDDPNSLEDNPLTTAPDGNQENQPRRARSFKIEDGQPNILIDEDELIKGNIVWAGATTGWVEESVGSYVFGVVGSNDLIVPTSDEHLAQLLQEAAQDHPSIIVVERPGASISEITMTSPIRIKHLVRAGLVDVSLMLEILSAKFGWSSIGFDESLSNSHTTITTPEWLKYKRIEEKSYEKADRGDGLTQDQAVDIITEAYTEMMNNWSLPEKVILGYWPIANNIRSLEAWQNGNVQLSEPYYLVDQDLDFVEPAYRQAHSGPGAFQVVSNENEKHLIGLEPTDWVKVNRADCLFAPEINYHLVMYPQSAGYRIGVDEHIPGLPEEAVRQLVNVDGRRAVVLDWNDANWRARPGTRPGRTWFPDRAAPLANNLDYFKHRGIGEWAYVASKRSHGDVGDPIPEFAENPEINNVPVPSALNMPHQEGADASEWSPTIASIEGTFTSQGYVAYNAVFPYGIPFLNDNWSMPIGYPTAGGMHHDAGPHLRYPWPYAPVLPTISELLHNLPPAFEDGFFSSVVGAGEDFSGGVSLNSSLTDFITEHIISLVPGGRQVGVHNGITALGHSPTEDSLHQYDPTFYIRDVTYGDLLDNVLNNRETTTANFTTQRIESVAEIPIKREVVDNLLRGENQNTSLLRFFQQIMAPSSIGLPGNVQLGVRNNNGVVEIFPATISYRGQISDMFKEAAEAEERLDQPENQLLFNYKVKNSLIESVDMSSKMDPAAFLTYQNSADLLRGRDFNVLKMLSYEGIALEFKQFLEGTLNVDGSGETYSGIVTADPTRQVKIDKVKFNQLPSSVLDAFIAQDPERWAKITATMQGQDNFTTELLAFYMRSATITIHGTTNLQAFNLIHITGVMPDLEGVYIITNLTEKITPTSYQTIIEGKLLKRKRVSENKFI